MRRNLIALRPDLMNSDKQLVLNHWFNQLSCAKKFGKKKRKKKAKIQPKNTEFKKNSKLFAKIHQKRQNFENTRPGSTKRIFREKKKVFEGLIPLEVINTFSNVRISFLKHKIKFVTRRTKIIRNINSACKITIQLMVHGQLDLCKRTWTDRNLERQRNQILIIKHLLK